MVQVRFAQADVDQRRPRGARAARAARGGRAGRRAGRAASSRSACTAPSEGGARPIADAIKAGLREKFGEGTYDVLRVETVGPKVGQGPVAAARRWPCSSPRSMMGVYIAFRFELRFGVGAAVALIHDVLMTLGALSLANMEFDLTTVAALLTVVGFSVHDTVIVSDRIRENMRKMRRGQPGDDHQRVDQRDAVADASSPAARRSWSRAALFLLGGQRDPQLRVRAARRLHRRHVLVDLRREPDRALPRGTRGQAAIGSGRRRRSRAAMRGREAAGGRGGGCGGATESEATARAGRRRRRPRARPARAAGAAPLEPRACATPTRRAAFLRPTLAHGPALAAAVEGHGARRARGSRTRSPPASASPSTATTTSTA